MTETDKNGSPKQGEETVTTIKVEPKLKKKAKKKKTSGSAKGIETMFRNTYRAQLDMLSLAATQANIMISLNGVIVSILMVTGGFIYASSPIFLLPAIVFLITSAISIYFALSAASPSPAPAHTRAFCCLRDVFKGKAKLRDFKNYMRLPEQRFNRQDSNILIFEDFATLPRETYLKHMAELIKDPDQIYEKMSDHLYRLGIIANNKYTMLRYSYSVFRWGLILSISIFLLLKALQYYFPQDIELTPPDKTQSSIMKFNGIYEPSGVQQLTDGRLIVIEDEADNPLHILNLKKNGELSEDKTLNLLLRVAFRSRLDDLEAITTGPDGYLYAATSHKRTKKGIRKADREQLIRFKIQGNKIIDSGVVTNLLEVIKESAILGDVDKQGEGGLYNINIEAISFNKDKQLMIGLRDPQLNDKSVILILENPVAIFTKKEKPRFSKKPLLLDTQGGGIRAISYDPRLKGYLLTNEIYGEGSSLKHSQIYFWDGNIKHKPKAIKLPNVINMHSVEGIAPVTIGDEPRVLLISDNGDIKQNRSANYLLLDYHQLGSTD